MKKKLTALTIALIMGIAAIVSGGIETKADTMTTVTPAYMKNMDEYDATVNLSYEHDFDMPFEMNGKESSEVIKLEIPKDSVVRMDVQSYEVADSAGKEGMSWGYADIYSNSALSNRILRLKYDCGSKESPDTEKALVSLKKGIYYVKVIAHRNSYAEVNETIQTKLFLTGITVEDAFSVTAKKASKGAYTLAIKSNLGTELNNVFYQEGAYGYSGSYLKLKALGADATVVEVPGTGKYSVIFAFHDAQFNFDLIPYNSVEVNVSIKGTDKTKPVISGVKNGKTYNKTVTIKFSDKESGIKSAKLNGKEIKSGAKISKNGSYKLVVTDKSGNKSVVKFKIKKS